MHVIGHAATHDDGGARQRRGGGQLVFRIRGIAQSGFQIDDAVVAKVLTELAVIGVDRDQARIDGVHQNAALAAVTGGKLNRCRRG
ncbi:hypothetical protein D3C80_2038860 [compost metagenome]